MKTILPLVLLAFVLVVTVYLIVRRKSDWPVGKACSICGAVTGYGYDTEAEDLANIKPMCLNCLVAQMEKESTQLSQVAQLLSNLHLARRRTYSSLSRNGVTVSRIQESPPTWSHF